MNPGGEKTYQMLWDCQFCGTTKLLGLTHRFCPNCGAPQNPQARYFPDEADKVAVEDHVFVGKDINCPSCNQLNSAKSKFCENCGSPLEGGKEASTLEAQTAGADGRFAPTASRDVVKENFDAEMERVGAAGKPANNNRVWLIVAAVVVVIAGVVFLFTRTREETALVVGHTWERNISIEQYSAFTERSWRDSPPFGERVSIQPLSCTREQRSSRQVPDGETCTTVRTDRGDGTFSEQRVCTPKYRSEPIYDDMCTWTGYRWMYERKVTTNGAALSDTPTWGQVTLNCANQSTLGCEREGGREERYTVQFRAGENANYSCTYNDEARWRSFGMESSWKLKVGLITNQPDCDDITSAAR